MPVARTSQQVTSKVRVQRRESRQPVSRRTCRTSAGGITFCSSRSLSRTRLAWPGGKVLGLLARSLLGCRRFAFDFFALASLAFCVIAASCVLGPLQTQGYRGP